MRRKKNMLELKEPQNIYLDNGGRFQCFWKGTPKLPPSEWSKELVNNADCQESVCALNQKWFERDLGMCVVTKCLQELPYPLKWILFTFPPSQWCCAPRLNFFSLYTCPLGFIQSNEVWVFLYANSSQINIRSPHLSPKFQNSISNCLIDA